MSRIVEGSTPPGDPDIIAAEIAEDLRAALEQFEAIAEDPNGRSPEPPGGLGGSDRVDRTDRSDRSDPTDRTGEEAP